MRESTIRLVTTIIASRLSLNDVALTTRRARSWSATGCTVTVKISATGAEGVGRVVDRRFHRLLVALAGYGYRAGRTASALLITLLIAGALGFWAGQVSIGNGHHRRPDGRPASVRPPGSPVRRPS